MKLFYERKPKPAVNILAWWKGLTPLEQTCKVNASPLSSLYRLKSPRLNWAFLFALLVVSFLLLKTDHPLIGGLILIISYLLFRFHLDCLKNDFVLFQGIVVLSLYRPEKVKR